MSTGKKKALGFWSATSMVAGNMIGSGMFLLPAALATFGGISIIGWIFSAVGSIFLALVFAGLARQIRGSGGPYLYTQAGFGDAPGFLVAWGYWISIIATNAAIAIALVSYLSAFWPTIASQNLLSTVVTLVFVWSLVIVNVRGVRLAGRVQLGTTILKILPLIAVGAFGLFSLDPSNFQPFNLSNQSNFSALTATASLTMWAFLGMESANIPAAEVENATSTVPRAAVAGTCIAALVYIPSTVAVMGLISPDQLVLSNAPFAEAAASLCDATGQPTLLANNQDVGRPVGFIPASPGGTAESGLFPF